MVRTTQSCADITLGDFWGANRLFADKDDDKGLSLVVVHSDKGRQAWEGLRQGLVFWPADLQKAAQYNPCMIRPAPQSKNRSSFFVQLGKKPMEQLVQELAPPQANPSVVKRIARRIIKK